MSIDISEKTALVTGPAGNLGSAVVEKFREAGASLILVDHRPDRLSQRYPGLAGHGDHLLLPGIDLLEPQQLESAVQQALEKFQHIDILVHTVGGFTMGDPVHITAAETWKGMLDLNAGTLLNAVRAVVPSMIAQESGRIITIGARPSWEGKPNMGAYSAAKAAVLRLTESMAAELKSKGITANCLIPGTIDTPENRQAMPDADTANWVQPSSLAEVILFLASDQAGDIRGAAVPVYGGVKS